MGTPAGQDRTGPLAHLKVIELAGIGPAPMCAMLLADLGATVLRIDRPEPAELGIKRPLEFNFLLRGRDTLPLDLKRPEARDLVLDLVTQADGLIEGFRPGVAERLGLGPEPCLARNKRLVYGRMTGWGQDGPLARTAAHDLNFIALTGALAAIGPAGGPPVPPLNLLGDFAGGSLYLAVGMLAAMLEAERSGLGQVVDGAIVDGVTHLLTSWIGMHRAGMLTGRRGTNVSDGGGYYYSSYECSDGRYLSVAPIEGKFHDEMLRRMGLDPAEFARQTDPAFWPEARARLAAVFRTRTRDEWTAVFAGSDACVAPVLELDEAERAPHLVARNAYVTIDGVSQPAPAPRFSRTVPRTPTGPRQADAGAALAGWLPGEAVARHREAGLLP